MSPGEAAQAQAIIQSSVAGDAEDFPASFQELYLRHAAPIGRFISQSVRDKTEAEDLSQEVWLRLYRNLEGIREPAAAGHWLYRTARHLCVDAARRSLRRPTDGAPVEALAAPSGESPEAASLRREDVGLACQGLSALPPRQHVALFAREVEGRSPGEISEELGCSLAAVETLLVRARRGLGAAYARIEGSQEERCNLARAHAEGQQAGAATQVQRLALRAHLQQCPGCARELPVRPRGRLHQLVGLFVAGPRVFGRYAQGWAGGGAAPASLLAGQLARIAILGSLSIGTVSLAAEDTPHAFSGTGSAAGVVVPEHRRQEAGPQPAFLPFTPEQLAVPDARGDVAAAYVSGQGPAATTEQLDGEAGAVDNSDALSNQRFSRPEAAGEASPSLISLAVPGTETTAIIQADKQALTAEVRALPVPVLPGPTLTAPIDTTAVDVSATVNAVDLSASVDTVGVSAGMNAIDLSAGLDAAGVSVDVKFASPTEEAAINSGGRELLSATATPSTGPALAPVLP